MTDEAPSVVEARLRAQEARERLFATSEELLGAVKHLKQRLQPSHLARDAWEAAKSKGADLAEEAVDAVARRPYAAGGIVAAIALFLAREPLMDLAGKAAKGKSKSKAKKKKAGSSKMETIQ